jgi:putative acetyltransferase
MLTIERECADTPEAAALLRARDSESDALYPPEEQFGIPAGEHVRDDVLFFIVREQGAPIGCGALELHEEYAEMKSVYLTPGARGRSLGRAIVRRLETAARELGYNEIRLETGIRSPWAVKTYERAGYVHCRRFGAYPENESSVFMMKRLASDGAGVSPNWPEAPGRHETGGEQR